MADFINLVPALVLLLASYRLSILISDVDEGGPWGVLTRIRHLVGVAYDDYSVPYGKTMMANAMLCVYCNSIWIGLFWTLLYFFLGGTAAWLALPLALSGGVVLLAREASS